MHELGITQAIVDSVTEHAKGQRVKRVVLEIGTHAGVMTDAIQFCFGTVAQGTPLEAAELEIRMIEARARCRKCGAEFVQDTLISPCDCGAHDVEHLSGQELNIKGYEIEAV